MRRIEFENIIQGNCKILASFWNSSVAFDDSLLCKPPWEHSLTALLFPLWLLISMPTIYLCWALLHWQFSQSYTLFTSLFSLYTLSQWFHLYPWLQLTYFYRAGLSSEYWASPLIPHPARINHAQSCSSSYCHISGKSTTFHPSFSNHWGSLFSPLSSSLIRYHVLQHLPLW